MKTIFKKEIDKDKACFDLLKEEYIAAKEEWKYYTDLFNKQDNLYSIYFAIFAIIIGGVYYISKDSNASIFNHVLSLSTSQKVLIAAMLLFLAVTYMYLFLIMMGNSYYLIIYSSKIIVLEEKLNQMLGKDVLCWEKDFMSKIQSTKNRFTKGYFNVNFLKTGYAISLYALIEFPLAYIWGVIFNWKVPFTIYAIVILLLTFLILYNWIQMWRVLPATYLQQLRHLYNSI